MQEDALMKIKRIHHVAYRCRDAAETVAFYRNALDMDFLMAFSEDHVPSTKKPILICTSFSMPVRPTYLPSLSCRRGHR